MYKVIIVDDEHIIVEGLSKGIDWAKYNCEVVGTAGSGEEGMELIRELSPDILFTDICMGEMDGLTMVAGIRSEFPNLQVTILTGYRDFEYAQRAIRLGASRFLLKPSKMEELIEAIGGMTAKLDLIKPGEPADEGDEETDAAASSYVVTRALNYMEKNYKEKLRLVDVAEKCFVSQWHLSKLLNKYEGIGFSDALNRIRVKKAEELLMDPTLRVSDIAEMVGFIDMAHLDRKSVV